jgi:leucyl-tRNA synthetase
MISLFKEQQVNQQDAPDHSALSFEEKQKNKYMCTFPFPYMNGYLHLGKFSAI